MGLRKVAEPSGCALFKNYGVFSHAKSTSWRTKCALSARQGGCEGHWNPKGQLEYTSEVM